MLDDVQRRSLLVQPAGKDALPPALRIADVELDEGAGQGLHLPGRGRLAGSKPDDRIADPNRLAGLEGDRAGDAVALVQKSDHRDPLGHRGGPGSDRRDRLRNVDRARLADGLAFAPGLLLGAAVTSGEGGGQGGRDDEDGAERRPHA
jgi:hypothetical protein